MVSNLDILCGYISEHPMNWNEAIEVYKNHPRFDAKNIFPLSSYITAFKHIWLELALENCALENPRLNISFQSYPNDGCETKNYRFHYDLLDRLFVFSRITEFPRKGRIHTGEKFLREMYESVIMVGDKPAIFDIKLTRWKNHGRSKGRWRDDEYMGMRAKGVQRFLTTKSRHRKLRPLREYWQREDLDYCIVIPKNVFEENKDSKTMRKAEEIGNRVIPFYTGRLEFIGEVREKLREHGLNIIDN